MLGSGALLGLPVFGPAYQPLLLLILPPGAFIALGLLLAAMNRWEMRGKG
jgi:electron transport complex protein RnfE